MKGNKQGKAFRKETVFELGLEGYWEIVTGMKKHQNLGNKTQVIFGQSLRLYKEIMEDLENKANLFEFGHQGNEAERVYGTIIALP